ncbi:MAG: glycoside hydrolase family 2 TIM barrel-domain containing protein, partial [Prevotella sp.]|nr:glycoside hydrolase family 2 TIM barrel-domain containing protein [Prevotella sp.]
CIAYTIKLPGSMLTNGKGDLPSIDTKWTGSLYDSSYYYNPYMEKYRHTGSIKFPFFLTPEHYYVGYAWYRHNAEIPRMWKKNRVILFLERPHIETTVFVNGKEVGHQMSLSVPHEYDITDYVKFGKNNSIAIKIYNGIENVGVGQDSHSVTDQTQGNWNGIVGKIELRSQKSIFTVKTFPDLTTGNMKVLVNDKEYNLKIDNPQPWSEFTPILYTRSIVYRGDTIPVTFGFRKIEVKGRDIMLNGRPIYVRGTVENCNFPLTGYPPTDVESWKKIIQKCKDYGINTMRFHSYCPPEAAFIAADSLGFYLQPEGPSWPNHGVKLNHGQHIDQYLTEETKKICDYYGNHPSFVMMAAGNEPAGDWVTWCNNWVNTMKEYDNRHIYCGASVGGGWAWDNLSEYHVKGGARGLDWDHNAPQCTDDYFTQIEYPRNYKGKEPNNSPIIAHEQGQWCAFPDFKERSLYTGPYKAKNFDIFEDLLDKNGMASQAENFLYASGKLQVTAYKYEIERNLRTKDYSGFLLLGLNDYSGQGTALVGPLNVFWKEKGYVDSKQWKEFCGDIVPLAKFPKFVFQNTDTLNIPIEVYNASEGEIKDADIVYSIVDKDMHNDIIAKYNATIKYGKNNEIRPISQQLNGIKTPSKLTLKVSVNGNTNEWDFWVYPAKVEMPKTKDIYITDTLDSKAIKILTNGGKVLITAGGKIRYGNDVKQTYLPVFWNTSWFKMRPPHTTGAYIMNNHPIFKDFTTDSWQNINWWELVNKAQVMNLQEFPEEYQPIYQPIDTWHVSRKLGMIVEANVLKGKLLMTTFDINNNLNKRIVARQLRKSILEYMSSNEFKPEITLDIKVIRDLFEKEATKVNMFTKDSPDELKPKIIR